MDRKTFWWSVISSIVAAVMVTCFSRLAALTWHVVTASSARFFVDLQDTAVSNAALGKRDWVAVILLEVVVTCLALVLSTQVLKSLLRIRTARKTTKALTAAEKAQKLQRLNKHRKRLLTLLLITTPAFWASLFFCVFMAYLDLQLNASFNQRLDAIAPYVDDQTIKHLRAEWATMKTLSDYRQITNEMDTLADQHGAKLPQVLYR
jgi:hypothetical protein